MSDLTAIDILIEPDRSALAHAEAENARMRAQYPDGFALDENHTPHITLLQRYVRSNDLEHVYNAVGSVIGSRDLSALTFKAHELRHMPVDALPGIGLAAIVVSPGCEVLEMQAALIEAVRPHTGTEGTAAAFVTTAQEPEINTDTLRYVERYVPDHSGENFVAHMTVGLAPLDFLGRSETSQYDAFEFHPSGLAVFKLGNNGTARQGLKRWQAG